MNALRKIDVAVLSSLDLSLTLTVVENLLCRKYSAKIFKQRSWLWV